MTGTSGPRPAAVTICGTFNLGLAAVAEAVDYFRKAGFSVLSPADPTPIEMIDGFLYVASDRHRDPMLVESRHLQAVAASQFVWLVAPEGYVGASGIAEVAYAAGRGIRVFTLDRVLEPAVAALVQRVPSAKAAIDACHDQPSQRPGAFLLEPDTAADDAHASVERLHRALTTAGLATSALAYDAVRDVRHALRGL